MIEPHMDVHPLSVAGGQDGIEFGGEARGWLFDEDVLARIHGRKHDFGKRVVRRRNDDHVNFWIVSDNPPFVTAEAPDGRASACARSRETSAQAINSSDAGRALARF